MVQPTPQSPAMVQSTPQRSGMVQRTPQHPAMVQALPEQAQAVRSPARPPRTVAAVSTQGAGQTLAERRNLAEIMRQVPETDRQRVVWGKRGIVRGSLRGRRK